MSWKLITVIVLSAAGFSGWYFRPAPSPTPTPKLVEEVQGDVRELSWETSDVKKYLSDSEDRVADEFVVSDFFYPNVQFWFKVYTHFSSNQIILHDKNNLLLIYKVLDFSPLELKGLGPNTLEILQKKIVKEKIAELRTELDRLIRHPFSDDEKHSSLYRSIQAAGLELPEDRKARVDFFKRLRTGVRTQTGQRNFIRDGLVRAGPYERFIIDLFSLRNLPTELLAIPFLESSFNPLAQSKANALGAWQFMPFISRHFMPKVSGGMDYRRNIGVASISAAHLMQENFRILKSWDLAVTAYNSGPKHLLKTKRSLASTQIDLEVVIKNSDSAHFGFASKNFYSEFLALAHALAYRRDFFPDVRALENPPPLRFYLSKCALKPHTILGPEALENLRDHNHQLTQKESKLPKGAILTSTLALPRTSFQEVDLSTKKRPRDWHLLVKNQSCSTK